MGSKLKFNHGLRIDVLVEKQRFDRLDAFLGNIAQKGFDVAGVPFRVIDRLLHGNADIDYRQLAPLARHTLGGQPRLFNAIVADLGNDTTRRLGEIVDDNDAHPMTRFEAVGWAVFARHRAAIPKPDDSGAPSAVADVFQFWDSATLPPEIAEGKRNWERAAKTQLWYDEPAACAYIQDGFGRDAATAFTALWHPALKSDVFRLYRLLKDGGLYCDADSNPEFQIAEFLQSAGSRVWASSTTNVPNCAAINGFMAAPPQAPFINALLEQVLRNTRDVNDRGIFWLSGPGAMTTHLYNHLGTYDVGLISGGALKSGLFKQFDAAYKHTPLNWRVFEHQNGLGNDTGLRQALASIAPT